MNPIKQEPVDENYGNLSMAGSDWTLETSGSDQEDTILLENEVKIEIPDELADVNLATLKEQHQKEISELKAKNQEEVEKALETKFAQMLSTQNEEHYKEMEQLKDGFAKEMAQLETKVLKLEEKLMSNVEVQTKKTLDGKMDQLQNEHSKMVAEQEKQMAQFQEQFHSLEQKLKETEQREQMGKNELEEIIQQKMENFREEMDKNGQQATGSNLKKLDYMWDQLMSKSKILANPKGIVWNRLKTNLSISECGLKLKVTSIHFRGWVSAIATEGYAISWEHWQKENFQFSGTLVYYYEVTPSTSDNSSFGFTDGSNPAGRVGFSPNSYGIKRCYSDVNSLWISGKEHKLECQTRVIAEVFGCGLLLNSKNELAVFFTVDGILLKKQIRINPTMDRLYPTVSIEYASVEANFGNNLVAKPFKFDSDKCPGLVFE